MRRILALDLAVKVGWAVRTDQLELGTAEFAPGDIGQPGARWRAFRGWLMAAVKRHDLETIAFEDVKVRNGFNQSSQVYGGFRAITELVAFEMGVELLGVSISEIKKTATGYSNADKKRMIDASQPALLEEIKRGQLKRIPGNFDDNTADAYWVLSTAEGKLSK